MVGGGFLYLLFCSIRKNSLKLQTINCLIKPAFTLSIQSAFTGVKSIGYEFVVHMGIWSLKVIAI